MSPLRWGDAVVDEYRKGEVIEVIEFLASHVQLGCIAAVNGHH